jgi:hypothetical protein
MFIPDIPLELEELLPEVLDEFELVDAAFLSAAAQPATSAVQARIVSARRASSAAEFICTGGPFIDQ